MKDLILIEISEVLDDETGIWTVGDLDYGIHGSLKDYMARHGQTGLENLQAEFDIVLTVAARMLANG